MNVTRKIGNAFSTINHPQKVSRAMRALKAFAFQPYPPIHASNAQFASLLAGSRVVLVGPAPTVVGSMQGDQIDNYDVIVRLNHSLPVPENMMQDIGSRTDIWYHNLWFEHPKALPPEELCRIAAETVQWLCFVNPYLNFDQYSRFSDRVDYYSPYFRTDFSFRTVLPRRYIWNAWRCRTLLSAGVSAILDLLAFEIKALYLTGFTFYRGKSQYHTGYHGFGSYYHDHDTQRALVRRIIDRDSRMTIDEGLARSLAT